MTVNLAINGFGRIGRCILRAWIESGRDDVTITAINDLAPVATNAHLLQFDSVHGHFNADVQADDGSITVNGHRIRVTSERDPAALPWEGVDIALECTGVFNARDKAAVKQRRREAAKGIGQVRQPECRRPCGVECVLHHQLPRAGGEGVG